MTTQHLNGVEDVDAPELFPEAFPPDGFPQVVFEGERPASLPADAWTTETTHRDGQQGGLPLTVEAGIRIYDLMCAFTGSSGGVRQAEFFVYRPADRRILQAATGRSAGRAVHSHRGKPSRGNDAGKRSGASGSVRFSRVVMVRR